MDHIPQPLNCDPDQIVISYLADQAPVYDGRGLNSFPLRCGYGISGENDAPSNENHCSETRYCAFLQSWLWFGLLQEVLETSLLHADFVRSTDDGQRILSTESLLQYISAARKQRSHHGVWHGLWPRRAQEQRNDALESPEELRVRALLAFALRSCEEVDQRTSHEDQETGSILLSVRILIETLSGLFTDEDCLPPTTLQVDLCSFNLIRKRLLGKPEMCRPRLEAVFRSVKSRPYTSLVYLSSLRRHELPWQTHTLCEEIGACNAFDIDEATFEGLHVTPTCKCENVSAPRDQMLAILRDGGMPGVRYRRDKKVGYLEYFRITSASRYVAISHLWSSGLGNLRSNDLPKCQLQRVLQLLQKVEPAWEDVEFWLDIYCIPVVQRAFSDGSETQHTAEMEALKSKALAWMPVTYSWARAVLVLDHEFGCIPSGADAVEILTTVHTSGWDSRYWTYQERRLSRTLLIQRGSSFVSAWDLLQEVSKAELRAKGLSTLLDRLEYRLRRSKGDGQLWTSGPRGFVDVATHSTSEGGRSDPADNLTILWNHLVRRRTTKWQDALSIMGNLLGHRASEMSQMSSKDQMRALIKVQHTLPFQILTIKARRYGRGPDRVDPESAWIPRSPVESEPINPSWPLLVRENGLVLRFHRSFAMTVVSYFAEEGIKSRVRLDIQPLSSFEPSTSIEVEVHKDDDLNWEPLAEPAEHLLVLESLVLVTAASERSGRGCLLLLVKRSSKALHARYCYPVSWRVSRDAFSEACEADRSPEIRYATVVDMEEQAIQFDCEIRSWPDLTDFKHTDIVKSWSRTQRRGTRILVYLSLCVLTVAIITPAAILLIVYGARGPIVFNVTLEQWLLPAIIVALVGWYCASIPIRSIEWVQGHLLFDFARPDYDPGLKKWQRLRRAIPSEKWSKMSWRLKLDIASLYVASWILYFIEGVEAAWSKVIPSCLRAKPRSESQIDNT